MAQLPKLNTPNLPKISLPSRGVLITGTVLILSIYVIWWLLLLILFDAETIERKTLAALEHHLGSKVEHAGNIYFSLTPLPKLTFQNIQVKNDPRAQQHSFLQVPKMVVTVHPLSIISSDLYVQLEAFSPRIEMETFADKTNSWDFDGGASDQDTSGEALITSFTLSKAGLHYVYPAVNRDITLQDINASLSFSEEGMEASGTLQLVRAYYQFNFNMEAGAGLAFSLTDGVSTLSLDGKWNSAEQSMTGKQRFETQDLGHFFVNFLQEEAQQGNQLADQRQYPLTMTGDLHYKDSIVRLDDVQVNGEYSQGTGQFIAELTSLVRLNGKFAFETLYLEPLIERGVFDHFISKSANIDETSGQQVHELSENKQTTLPQGVELGLVITSAKTNILGAPATNLQLAAKMEDARIELSQFSGVLPGQTQFVLNGVVEGGYEGLALKGQLDVAGQEFIEFFTAVSSGKLGFPDSYKRFRGRANLFANSGITRLSEGILRVDTVQLLGTLIKHNKHIQNDSTVREVAYEGAFRVDNLNLNQLIDAQQTVDVAGMDDYPQVMRVAKQLTTGLGEETYNFKFSLLDYELNGLKRPKALLTLAFSEDAVAVQNLQASYNNTYLSGDFLWHFPADGLPSLQAKMKADILNTKEFFGADFVKEDDFWRDENGQWSKREFDFEWLRKFNAEFEFTVGILDHKIYRFEDLFVKGDLKDSTLEIRDFKTDIWQGMLKGSGGLRIAKLPAIYAKFNYNGLRVDEFHPITDLFDDVSGRVSIDGDVTSTGVNVYSMMQNAQGAFALGGVGLTIKGFNLANMVRAANTVRTVSDIEKLVAYANQEGSETAIQRLQGSINLNNGFMRTPGLQIATKVGNGTIKGQVNMMDWNIEVAIAIYLTALQQTSPPNIRLIFDGPISATRRTLDTQSLESFIARQAAERLLDTR